MNKKYRIELMCVFSLALVVIVTAAYGLLVRSINQNFAKSSEVISRQVNDLIHSNEAETEELQETLKEEYISKAKALAYVLEHTEGLEEDYDELCKVADLLDIDEINIFGKDGLIAYSTVPDYVGYSIYSGGQIAFFLPLMDDHDLSLCQDLTPNSKEGKLIMYAMTWRSDGESMVQVGISPERLLQAMQDKDISKLLDHMPLSDSVYFVIDAEKRVVVASTESSLVGKAESELDMAPGHAEGIPGKLKADGNKYIYLTYPYDEYIIGVGNGQEQVYHEAQQNTIILLVFLALCMASLFAVIIIVADREQKKELEYQSQLKSALKLAEEASGAKSQFLFNMSHDIRTPMNAITGYSVMAKKNADNPEKVRDYLDKITTSGNQLLSLVNQVLEMSRIESGKVVLAEDVSDVREYFDSTVTIVTADVNAKGLKLEKSIENIRHPKVITDISRMNQIVINIIGNAVKYTPEGGTIRFSITELDSNEPEYGLYKIIVADNGIGMSREFLSKIFDEFSRENTSTVSRIQGTGLGMSIVKRLVDLMNGTINVNSEKGKGTTITLLIPLKICEDAMEEDEPGEARGEVSLEGLKILLVEDNEMNREIATDILEDNGVTVFAAEDGDIAVDMVKKAKKGDYDVVLMDIQMPRMNGFEATKAIRALEDPALAGIPIIAMTANAFEEDRKRALASGMDEHIAKPINIEKMKEAIARFARKGSE